MSTTDEVLPAAEPSSVRLALTLGVAGLLSGLALVFAYEATLPTIEANRREALRRAVFEVVPGSGAMHALVADGDGVAVAGADAEGPRIYAAYRADGAFAGYAIPARGAGFQDTIALIYGFDPKTRNVIGMRVLESRETPGLGDKIFKDPGFVAEFDELATVPDIVAVPHGTAKAAHEIDAITGATISSKAVVRIVNEGNRDWLARLPQPGAEPPLREEGPK